MFGVTLSRLISLVFSLTVTDTDALLEAKTLQTAPPPILVFAALLSRNDDRTRSV